MKFKSVDFFPSFKLAGGIGAPQPLRLVMTGFAGSGKTSLIEPLSDLILALSKSVYGLGGKVRGVAPTGAAARVMKQVAKIPATTLHTFVEYYERLKTTRIDESLIVIVDESSMIGSRDLARLVRICDRFCFHLILMGDPNQLAPLSAGDMFKILVDEARAAGTLIELDENFRQRDITLRIACDMGRSRRMSDGLKHLKGAGMVIECGDMRAAMVYLANLWRPDRVILAPTRRQTGVLNELVRRKKFSAAERRGEICYRAKQYPWSDPWTIRLLAGDEIMFTHNDHRPELDVRNGETAVVTCVSEDWFAVKRESGIETTILARDYCHYDYAYAVTNIKSQGRTYDAVLVLAPSKDVALENMRAQYVQITRARDYCLIVTDDYEELLKLARLGEFARSTLPAMFDQNATTSEYTYEDCLVRMADLQREIWETEKSCPTGGANAGDTPDCETATDASESFPECTDSALTAGSIVEPKEVLV